MEEKVLKGITFLSLAMSFIICGSLYFLPGLHDRAVLAAEAKAKVQESGDVTVVSQNENPEDIVEVADDIDAQLRIEVPSGLSMDDLQIENDYITQTIYIRVDTDEEDYFSNYRISGRCNHIDSLSYYKDSKGGVIALELDKVYELDSKFDNGNLLLDFVNPHDIYDKVVVVDAGHGGRASGAVKLQVEEKEIDLNIAKQLKKLFDESDGKIGVYYTRLDDGNPTLDQRVQLANKADADLFVSIHNNSTSHGNFSSLEGTQVLYSQSDSGKYSSKKFSQILLNNVCDKLNSRKIGLLKGDDIYIIRTSEVPVGLVEVGFMTNRKELDKLQDLEYQKAAAQGIYNGIMQAFQEGF